MSLKDDVQALIDAKLPDNAANEISAQDTRESFALVLDNLDNLGSNYYGTKITSDTAPPNPAEGATVTPLTDGVYINFSSLERLDEICYFEFDGVNWVKKTIVDYKTDIRSLYSNNAYISYSDTASFIDIDLDNLLVKVSGTVFAYTEHGFKFVPVGDVSIGVGHRYILWDDENDLIYTSTLDLITNSNVNSYIIAVIREDKLIYIYTNRYKLNGVEVSIPTDITDNKAAIPILTKEDKYMRSGYVSYPDGAASSININFIAMEFEVVGNVFIFIKDGFKFIPIGTTAIAASDRYILWNNTTESVEASGADMTTAADDDIYIIAAIRSASSEVMTFNSHKYKLNGVEVVIGTSDTPPPIAERHNLINYVEGQEAIGEKYSAPVCDLYRESGLNFQNSASFIQVDLVHYEAVGYTHIAQQTTEFIRKYGGFVDLTGKTIGVFGGSYSVIVESQACKNVWVSELGITYTDHGVGGAGFSSLASSQIDTQVDTATSKDIFIVWCSGNDAGGNTPILGVNSTDITSQSYGMSQTIEKLITLNPQAKIFLFNSLKYYLSDWAYDPTVDRY